MLAFCQAIQWILRGVLRNRLAWHRRFASQGQQWSKRFWMVGIPPIKSHKHISKWWFWGLFMALGLHGLTRLLAVSWRHCKYIYIYTYNIYIYIAILKKIEVHRIPLKQCWITYLYKYTDIRLILSFSPPNPWKFRKNMKKNRSTSPSLPGVTRMGDPCSSCGIG